MADPVTDPVAEHDARYGEEGAGPPEWAWVRDRLARAGVAWFTTMRRRAAPRRRRSGAACDAAPGVPGAEGIRRSDP
ncbi:hypothetical protein AB0M95_04005 [Sphaerisporangium sp. NPDC051017]|uniref:hypothetical protein n=1 Tax=Sphaerisporangium sp. NPDC051017 TaxID=3154636 RepID=UPI003439B3DF